MAGRKGHRAGRLVIPDDHEQATMIGSPRDLVSDVDLRVLEGRIRILEGHRQLSQLHWKHFEEMLSAQPQPRVVRSPRERVETPEEGEHLCNPVQACCLLIKHPLPTEKASPRLSSVERFHPQLARMSTKKDQQLSDIRLWCSLSPQRTPPVAQSLVPTRSLPWGGCSALCEPQQREKFDHSGALLDAPACNFVEASPSSLASPMNRMEGQRERRLQNRHLRVVVPEWQGSPASSPATVASGSFSPTSSLSPFSTTYTPPATMGQAASRRAFRRRHLRKTFL